MKKVACVVLLLSRSSPDKAEIRAQTRSHKSWKQFQLTHPLRFCKYKRHRTTGNPSGTAHRPTPYSTGAESMLERVKGIEPSSQAWEARILPLNHTRLHHSYLLTELSKGGNSHFVIFGSDSRLFFVSAKGFGEARYLDCRHENVLAVSLPACPRKSRRREIKADTNFTIVTNSWC